MSKLPLIISFIIVTPNVILGFTFLTKLMVFLIGRTAKLRCYAVQLDCEFLLFWLRFWLRFGHGLGDDRGDVTVADDHYGRQEMLHDFNGIVSIGLTRSSSAVTA